MSATSYMFEFIGLCEQSSHTTTLLYAILLMILRMRGRITMANFHEYFVIVKKTDLGLEVHGCVTRDLAHSEFRVPHTSVNLVPVFQDTDEVLIHRQSPRRRISPCKLDFAGGHVNFELALPGDPDALLAGVEKTALREAREELWLTVKGKPYIIPKGRVRRFTELGELTAGLDDPTSKNVEFSTGFIVFLPANAEVQVMDEEEILCHERLSIEELLRRFQKQPDDFADGASRTLSKLSDPQSYKKFMSILTEGPIKQNNV